MPGGANSQSSGTNSLSGVDGPGKADKVISDAVSKDIGNSAAGNFGPGSSVPGGSSSRLPSAWEKKMGEFKSYWTQRLGKVSIQSSANNIPRSSDRLKT